MYFISFTCREQEWRDRLEEETPRNAPAATPLCWRCVIFAVPTRARPVTLRSNDTVNRAKPGAQLSPHLIQTTIYFPSTQ